MIFMDFAGISRALMVNRQSPPTLTKFRLLVLLFCAFTSTGLAQSGTLELSDLTISYGSLSPSFQAQISSYTLSLSSTIPLNEIQLTPTTNCTDCFVIINHQNVYAGSSWFIADGSKEIKIDVINELGKSKTYYIFINQIKPALYISDSMSLADVTVINQFKRPRWLDKNGYLYANSYDTIFKSIDKGLTWTPIYVVPDSLGGNELSPALIVSQTNRVIFCSNGQVVVSDETQKNFENKYNFYKHGSPQGHLAHSMYDSIILMGTYQYNSDTAEAIISTDYGKSWKKIFEIGNKLKVRLHIHDIVYDHFSKRIIIATGDSRNAQIYYSDDLGATWQKVFKSALTANLYQTSQIAAFSHGLVLGSDGPKDGLLYLPKLRTKNGDFLQEDLRVNSENFIKIDNSRALKRFAVRQWQMTRGGKTLFLMPFYHCVFPSQKLANDFTRLWASFNGIEWHELYKWHGEEPKQLFGFENIIGPHPLDIDNTIFSTFSGQFFKANILFPEKLPVPYVISPLAKGTPSYKSIFEWSTVRHALTYQLQISDKTDFTNPLVDDNSIEGSRYYCDKLVASKQYYWRVKAIGFEGESDWSNSGQFVTSADENSADSIIDAPILYQNVPNPFTVSTKILYYVPDDSDVKLTVYDSFGNQVIVESSTSQAGIFVKEITSQALGSSGVYFADLQVISRESGNIFKKSIRLLLTQDPNYD